MPLTQLNVFQRIMRMWDEVHPYNAAQILHLEGAPDIDKLGAAWNAVLSSLGLGRVYVHGGGFRHEAPSGRAAAQPLRIV